MRSKEQPLIPLGFEPRTSRVLGERDNHYTMESALRNPAVQPRMFLGQNRKISIRVIKLKLGIQHTFWNRAIHCTLSAFSSMLGTSHIQSYWDCFKIEPNPTSVYTYQLSKSSTRMGFEPTRAEPNGLAVHRLNHSATSSWANVWLALSLVLKTDLNEWIDRIEVNIRQFAFCFQLALLL